MRKSISTSQRTGVLQVIPFSGGRRRPMPAPPADAGTTLEKGLRGLLPILVATLSSKRTERE